MGRYAQRSSAGRDEQELTAKDRPHFLNEIELRAQLAVNTFVVTNMFLTKALERRP
jgi:hypothetical protein